MRPGPATPQEALEAVGGRFGHTALSAEVSIPWGALRLIVGIGSDGLPSIMAQGVRIPKSA